MGKEEFVKVLCDAGYDAFNEKGVVMIYETVENVGAAHDAVMKLAYKHDYRGSLGVRLKNEKQDIV